MYALYLDKLEEIEEITTNTNYIIEICKNTSIICSGNMKYKINKSAKNIIDENCKNFGSTLKGRIDSAKSKTNFKYKTPIILSEQLKLVLFPIGNYENAQNAWFSLKTIANYRSIKNGKTEELLVTVVVVLPPPEITVISLLPNIVTALFKAL